MKLAVLSSVLCNYPLEKALEILHSAGVFQLELSCGGEEGKNHCDPEILLNDEEKFNEFVALLNKYEMSISALNCYGNPLHPVKAKAENDEKELRNTVLLAEKLGVDTIVCYSGIPGNEESSLYPHWATTVHPAEPIVTLNRQLKTSVYPFWKQFVVFAKEHGVNKIAIDLTAGTIVYNSETLLNLRKEIGPEIGACLDPSHLLWLGMNMEMLCKRLKGCIYAVHANDIYIDEDEMGRNGVFDPFWDEENPAFSPRVAGNGIVDWTVFMTSLVTNGYHGSITADHKDPTIGQMEGLYKAISCLDINIISDEEVGCPWRKALEGGK